jgi:hydrogenase maturation protease
VLVVGIGNILLRDEGVGVRVIEAMSGMPLPEGVEAVDGGTSGADLVDIIADRPKVIVVDAVRAESKPASVFRFGAEDLLAEKLATLSLHQLGLVETLRMAQQLGCAPGEVVIFGIIPKEITPGLELSDEVNAVVPRVIKLVLAEARRGLGSPVPDCCSDSR